MNEGAVDTKKVEAIEKIRTLAGSNWGIRYYGPGQDTVNKLFKDRYVFARKVSDTIGSLPEESLNQCIEMFEAMNTNIKKVLGL